MSKLLSKLLKAGSAGSTVLSDSDMFKDQDLVKTLPIINVAYSGKLDGGFGSGLTVLAGESKTFKTALALYCLKAYLDKYPDGIGILYDSEGGCNPQYVKSFGIDPTRIIHVPVEHVEQLKFDFVKKLEGIEKGDKVFFLVDSIGQIASKKETEDASDEKSVADMTRAKAIRSLLRLITVQLNKKLLPCFMINHVYMEIGMFPKTIIPGGCLGKDTLITMYDGSLKAIQDIAVNDMVKTLEGPKPVTDIWNPETLVNGTPECFEIEFADEYKVVCSDKHPFLTTRGWVKACDLTGDEDIVRVG
jgi:RecA/RadA recombinase